MKLAVYIYFSPPRRCIHTISITRQSLDSSGGVFLVHKNLHVVVRRGSAPGMTIVFEGEGHESTSTLPGDVVVTLREQPMRGFRRVGPKSLVRVGPAAARGDVFYCDAFKMPNGNHAVLVGSVLLPSLEAGGKGGTITVTLAGDGMLDPDDPWDKPPGDMTESIFYPAVDLAERVVRTCVRPAAVMLCGCAEDGLAGAVAGALSAAAQAHRRLAEELWEGDPESDPASESTRRGGAVASPSRRCAGPRTVGPSP